MKKFDYEVTNALGIHARPAAMLAQICTNHKVTVEIECNGETIYVSNNGWGTKSKMEELQKALSEHTELGFSISEAKE